MRVGNTGRGITEELNKQNRIYRTAGSFKNSWIVPFLSINYGTGFLSLKSSSLPSAHYRPCKRLLHTRQQSRVKSHIPGLFCAAKIFLITCLCLTELYRIRAARTKCSRAVQQLLPCEARGELAQQDSAKGVWNFSLSSS